MAEIPVEKKSSLAWLWVLLGLILAALILWWLLSGDDEPEAAGVAGEQTVAGSTIDQPAAAGAGALTSIDSVEEANQRALERIRNDPNATPRVYFVFDSAELTSGAQAVLDAMIEGRTDAGTEGVTLTGFADRVGTQPYNQQLSEQRAEQVRQYLAGKGIGADQIEVEAEGETPPLVETGDGVREPLNRRVRIEMGDSE